MMSSLGMPQYSELSDSGHVFVGEGGEVYLYRCASSSSTGECQNKPSGPN